MPIDGYLVLWGTIIFSVLTLYVVHKKYKEQVERSEDSCKQFEIDMGVTTHIYTQR